MLDPADLLREMHFRGWLKTYERIAGTSDRDAVLDVLGDDRELMEDYIIKEREKGSAPPADPIRDRMRALSTNGDGTPNTGINTRGAGKGRPPNLLTPQKLAKRFPALRPRLEQRYGRNAQ